MCHNLHVLGMNDDMRGRVCGLGSHSEIWNGRECIKLLVV